MPPAERYRSKREAFVASSRHAATWVRNRLPTFAGGLVAVLIVRYFLGEPFYPMFTMLGVVSLLLGVLVLGTLGTFVYTVLSGGVAKGGGDFG